MYLGRRLLPAIILLAVVGHSACAGEMETAPAASPTPRPRDAQATPETTDASPILSIQPTQDPSEAFQILSLQVDNAYPDALTFRISAEAQSPVERVVLYYRTQGTSAPTYQPVEVPRTRRVRAAYTWDTARFTVAPSTPIFYHWRLEDAVGNTLETEEQKVFYDDLRFDWQERRESELIVRWYAGDDEFGEFVFLAASEALGAMEAQTRRSLDFPIIVLLYADDADFASWHFHVEDWVGGQAFPPLGVTAQIVPPSSPQNWIEDVIPHEIAHLFFYQVAHSELSGWPTWLDEGFAQYFEPGDPDDQIQYVRRAAEEGRVLPLSHISGTFGSDPDRVRLAYAESVSALAYMFQIGGEAEFERLTTALSQGGSFREALQAGFGMSLEEFEAGWLTWLGVPATPAAQPTAWPTFGVIGLPTSTPHSGTPTP
jgi:hypothetical protein